MNRLMLNHFLGLVVTLACNVSAIDVDVEFFRPN